jgi:hypothetical protein
MALLNQQQPLPLPLPPLPPALHRPRVQLLALSPLLLLGVHLVLSQRLQLLLQLSGLLPPPLLAWMPLLLLLRQQVMAWAHLLQTAHPLLNQQPPLRPLHRPRVLLLA